MRREPLRALNDSSMALRTTHARSPPLPPPPLYHSTCTNAAVYLKRKTSRKEVGILQTYTSRLWNTTMTTI